MTFTNFNAAGNDRRGFTLVEIMIVVMILGLLTALAIPSMQRARDTAQKNACLDNLRMINSAIQQYILEYKQTVLDGSYESFLDEYVQDFSEVSCPAGGTYAHGDGNSVFPSCDIPGHVIPPGD